MTRRVAIGALADAAVQGSDLKGIGITNQRETVVAWDPSTGEPVHRALVWQDRRTAARCDELREQGHEALIRERTGLVIDPYFSGTKIEWLIQNADLPEDVAFGTIDSWLVFKLTGRHLIDYSNASRTMLFDIRKLAWDDELCDLLGVDPRSLPEPVPSSEIYGTTSVFGGEVPVAGIAGDQQAALFGQACQRPGETKNTYGTGSFVLLNTGLEAPEPGEGLLTTVAWGLGGEVAYALEAAVFVTGAAVQWLRDGLGIIDGRRRDRGAGRLAGVERRRLLRPGPDRARLAALGPVRARDDRRPHPRLGPRASGASGARGDRLPDGRRRARAGGRRRARACPSLKADGGAVANAWLMQFQADVLGVPVIVPEVAETTALGAAYLAGIATGLWTAEQVREMWREAARYEPRMPEIRARGAARPLAGGGRRARAAGHVPE